MYNGTFPLFLLPATIVFTAMLVPIPIQVPTASTLKTADPTIVPTPRSPFVTKVPITFVNNSGADVLIAMNVAPATFGAIRNSKWNHKIHKIQHFSLNNFTNSTYMHEYDY